MFPTFSVDFSYLPVPEPVAYFPLNAKYGTKDVKNQTAQGIANDASLARGPRGEEGGSYEFFGRHSSYIEFPNNVGGALDVRYSITMLCWLYSDSQNGPIFNYKTSGSYGVHFWVVQGKLFVRFNARNYAMKDALTHSSLLSGWTFVGASYDHSSGEAKLWVDETAVLTKNVGNGYELGTQENIRMGVRISDARYFKGRITQMRVYDVALSQEHVLAILNQEESKQKAFYPLVP